MSFVAEEIASQPACWRTAATLAGDVAALLPQRGERVAVVGCGTSFHMATAYAALREAAGHGETDTWTATELRPRPYDRVMFLSRTGTTTEVLDALAGLPAEVAVTALTATPSSPLAERAQHVVPLAFADERSVLQTRYATSALVLLRTHLGEDTTALPDAAEQAVAAPLPDGALSFARFTFVGQRWRFGLAEEACLKLREASQTWTEAYQSMEYRHGPMSGADTASLVWSLGPLPAGLAADVRNTGATVVEATADPLCELIRIQRLAVALAEAHGLDPDHPRHLNRSVILPTTT